MMYLVLLVFVSMMSCFTASELRVALCLTGQLARLELRSKLANLVARNTRQNFTFDVFASLYAGEDRRVNAFYSTSSSPHLASDGASFDAAGIFESRTPLTITGGTHGVEYWTAKSFNATFGFHLDLRHQHLDQYVVNEGLAALGDKFRGNLTAQMARERLHMSQWHGLKRCMLLVTDFEKASGNRFHVMAKLRDDSVVYAPFILNKRYILTHSQFLMTLNCMNSRRKGIHDNFYLFDRGNADCFLNAFVDVYAKDGQLLAKQDPPLANPERYVAFYARMCDLKPVGLSLCNAPVLSMDFVPGRPADSHADMWIRGGTIKKRHVLLPCATCEDTQKRSCFSKSPGAPGLQDCHSMHSSLLARIDRQVHEMKAFNLSTYTKDLEITTA